jgi:hypothetical protein
MFLVNNKAILETFSISKIQDSYEETVYEFKNKVTGKILKASRSKVQQNPFQQMLGSVFFPNSVLILTSYLADLWNDSDTEIRKHFNYKGFKFSENYKSYFIFEDKPNLMFGETFYFLREQTLRGGFNRQYFDCLIEKVLPLVKDEAKALYTFFKFFSTDFALRGKFVMVDNFLSTQATSIFSNSSKVSLDFDLTSLHGKIMVGEQGIEVLDSSFIANHEEIQQALGLGQYVSEIPQDRLTQGRVLEYTEDICDFSNWFYQRNNLEFA